MITILLQFIIGTLFSGFCLWAAMRLFKINGTFPGMLAIAAIAELAGLIPFVGLFISFIVMLVLICKFTDAYLLPHAVLMVIVAFFIQALIMMYISNIHL
jgi:predicted PurR-regulated permease PerM